MIRNSALVFLAATTLTVPAAAQQGSDGVQPGDEKINQLIIYGDDVCPESTEEQINVCVILVEADRYRIPPNLRDTEIKPSNESWTKRAVAYQYVGRDGIMSCSPTGAGGFTGCGLGSIDQAYAEKKQDPGLVFGRLIAQQRAERLAQIDAEALAVEEKVKLFEQGRLEREAREQAARDGLDAADAADAAPLPEPQ